MLHTPQNMLLKGVYCFLFSVSKIQQVAKSFLKFQSSYLFFCSLKPVFFLFIKMYYYYVYVITMCVRGKVLEPTGVKAYFTHTLFAVCIFTHASRWEHSHCTMMWSNNVFGAVICSALSRTNHSYALDESDRALFAVKMYMDFYNTFEITPQMHNSTAWFSQHMAFWLGLQQENVPNEVTMDGTHGRSRN